MRLKLGFSVILVYLFLTGIFLAGSSHAIADTPKFSLTVYGGITQESLELPALAGVSSSTDGTEALGFGIGYNFNESSSLQFDMVRGGIDISATGPGGSVNDEIEIETMALYFSTRTSGNVFLKLKAGVLRQELNSSNNLVATVTDTGASYGIGVGYNLSQNLSLEAEYVIVDQDGGWILASGRFSFGG